MFGLNTLPWYAGLFIALVCASITICCVALIMVPRLKKEILGELITSSGAPPTSPFSAGGGMIGMSAITKTGTKSHPSERSSAAYDNVTFKPDDPVLREALESRPKAVAPMKPRRELTLDPKQLTGGEQAHKSAETTESQPDSKSKPSVAPKPAHLRRQAAQDQTSQQLDEIDLGKPAERRGESAPSGRTTAITMTPAAQYPPPKPADGQPSYTFSGERYEVAKLFASLQILTACFASFAHGTNDVSNAVAPLIPIWNIYTTGTEDVTVQTQVWILAFGSIGICTGLWAWGRAVMATISEGLTKITPSKGFSVELGAAISVLVATKMGLPISTTHCKVGSLVIVGFVSSKFLARDNLLNRSQQHRQQQQQQQQQAEDGKQELEIKCLDEEEDAGVDWKLFGNIAITWVSTVPMAAAASASVMYIIKWLAI